MLYFKGMRIMMFQLSGFYYRAYRVYGLGSIGLNPWLLRVVRRTRHSTLLGLASSGV